MKLKIGNPATGPDFFPRESVRNRLLRALARDHVAFVGPRRTGKTSILKHIAQHPPTGTEAVFLMQLSKGEKIPLNETAGRRILKLMGANWPILLELFMSELQDKELKKSPTMPELKDLYEVRMVRGSRNKYCQEMFTRLSKDELFSPTERRIAFESLKLLISQPVVGGSDLEMIHSKIVPDEKVRSMTGDELGFVIDTLRHDGYLLRRNDGQYQFASNILRDYWIHRTA